MTGKAVEAPLIGLDVGTHSVRALAFSRRGEPVATEVVETPAVSLGPGSADLEPEALWQAVRAVLGRVAAGLPGGRIAGVAVASIGESCVLVDRSGNALHNALVWYDRRTAPQAEWLAHTVGPARFHDVTGLSVDPIYGICKLLWLREHAAEAFARSHRVLNVADWIAFRLSGEMATDFSLASRTGLLDLHARTWSTDLLEAVGLSPELLAPLRPSGTPLGRLLPAVAESLGIERSCVVGVGGHDHICGGMAVGAYRPGVLLDSMGTAEALLLPVQQPVRGRAVREAGFAQGAIEVGAPYAYLLAALNSAGGSVEWFRDTLAAHIDYQALVDEAERAPPGSDGACFIPHMAFSPPPNPDPRGRGAFIGLSAGLGRGAVFRSVLEGLALAGREMLDAMEQLVGGTAATDIRAIGGGTRNPLLMRIKASAYGRPLTVVDQPEATALGAAMLAGLAAGVYPDIEAAHAQIEQRHHAVAPDPAWMSLYSELHERVFRHAYEHLRPLNHAIAEMQGRR